MVPVFTLYQIFGVIEAAAWIALVVYDIINMIRLGVSFPVNAGSMYYMVLVIAVLTIICKIWQGIALTKFLHGLKRSIHSEKVKKGAIGGIKFASIMLTLGHAILLAALVINLLIALGIEDFFRTFQYLWMVYLFFVSYIFRATLTEILIGQSFFRYRECGEGCRRARRSGGSRSSSSPQPGIRRAFAALPC